MYSACETNYITDTRVFYPRSINTRQSSGAAKSFSGNILHQFEQIRFSS